MELSIVLVILGLLVGGVLSGRSLIKAAELRSVPTDFNRYYAASMTFKDKYFSLPGDMTNATAFWGTSTACGGASATGTCNGDGNGAINDVAGGMPSTEIYMFWQHMAKAGMIEGNYSGPLATDVIAGISVPKSRIANAYFTFPADVSGNGSYFRVGIGQELLTLRNNLVFGSRADDSSGNGGDFRGVGGALTSAEAWNIDTKMDDGRPFTGKVVSDVSSDMSGNGSVVWVAATPSALPCYLGDAYRLSNVADTPCILSFRVY